MVTFLSGGTGTPKLLWGADSVFSLEGATVIANTGDDVELGGLHVSPDLDTVLFERARILDRETWWGIADDPTVTHEALTDLAAAVGIGENEAYLPASAQTEGRRLSRWRRFAAVPEFMTIGDRDRAVHVVRSALLDDGYSLTEATARLANAHSLDLELLPMSDHPVATLIHTPGGLLHFQEYWVGRQGETRVADVEFRGAASAAPTEAVFAALEEPVVIGPANPVTSLGPMLALEGFEERLANTSVVAVSPFVGATAFSGPAPALMRGTGREPSTSGFAGMLPMVDAFVLDHDDETALRRPVVRTDTRIEVAEDARRVARACADALAKVD